jgi:hypothetical protein
MKSIRVLPTTTSTFGKGECSNWKGCHDIPYDKVMKAR